MMGALEDLITTNAIVDSTMISKPLCFAALVIFLLSLIYFELEKVHPTSKDLGADAARQPLPLPLKLIDMILDRLPFVLCDIYDAAALLREGAQDAGLPESGYSPDVIESLETLVRSFNEDNVKMHFIGRRALHAAIVTGLSQYLQIHEAHRLNPELKKQKLNNPMVLVGLGRSGTTHLHRMLASAQDVVFMPMWESYQPVPPRKGFDFRRLQMHVDYFFWKYFANRFGLDSIHFIRPDLPEECLYALRIGGSSLLPWALAPAYGYLDWLCNNSTFEETYRTHRMVLQLIQARDPNKRIILKCPTHSLALKTLTKIIPEAQIVMTHRDPWETVSSETSLFVRLQSIWAKEPIDWKRTARANCQKCFVYTQRLVEFTSQSPAPKVYHVPYRKLTNDPLAIVADIHKFYGIQMTQSHKKSLSKFLRQNKQHSHGKHYHSKENIGLTDGEMRKGFQVYMDFFAEYLNNTDN